MKLSLFLLIGCLSFRAPSRAAAEPLDLRAKVDPLAHKLIDNGQAVGTRGRSGTQGARGEGRAEGGGSAGGKKAASVHGCRG